MQEESERYIRVRDIGAFKNLTSIVFPIEIRDFEGIRCFVQKDAIPQEVQLPNDFFLREFMELNPDDVNELLEFQCKWGLIESRHVDRLFINRDRARNSPKLVTPKFTVQNTIPESAGVPDALEDEIDHVYKTEQVRKEAYAVYVDNDFDYWDISEEILERSRAVCIEEAQACVKNTQMLIKAIVDGTRYGVIKAAGNKHFELTKYAVSEMTSIVEWYFPSIELLDYRQLRRRNTKTPLIPLVFAQCMFGIQAHQRGDYEFHECEYKNCGKTFQFGRKSEEGSGMYKNRRKGSSYCCPKCQEYNGKHKYDEYGDLIY